MAKGWLEVEAKKYLIVTFLYLDEREIAMRQDDERERPLTFSVGKKPSFNRVIQKIRITGTYKDNKGVQMKKHIRTRAVSTVILDHAKTKVNLAIRFVEGPQTDSVYAWRILQDAKRDLYLLETIFYCEQENAVVDRIKNIAIKIAFDARGLSDISRVARESYQMIKDLEDDIAKELENSEFSPANVEKLLMESAKCAKGCVFLKEESNNGQ